MPLQTMPPRLSVASAKHEVSARSPGVGSSLRAEEGPRGVLAGERTTAIACPEGR